MDGFLIRSGHPDEFQSILIFILYYVSINIHRIEYLKKKFFLLT
jgi:hypothetical protein